MAKANKYYAGSHTDHFDGVRFFNPDQIQTDRSFGDLLRWKLGETSARWPASVPGVQTVPDRRVAGLRVTMVGHATALIQTGSLNVLTDPVWSERPSPLRFVGPRRVVAPGVALADLPPIDVVLLSHNHYDHLDLATLRQLQAVHQPLMVTPLGNDAIVRQAIPEARVIVGDWWQPVALPGGAEATIVPAYHWSARGIRDRRMALWGGFMLRSSAGLVYFSGDTGYGSGSAFREMHTRFGPPDMALLPIGAYAPRWFMCAQHINPAEAVSIMEILEATLCVGIHWGVFQLTDEPREEPVALLREALRQRHLDARRFVAACPGDVLEPFSAWQSA